MTEKYLAGRAALALLGALLAGVSIVHVASAQNTSPAIPSRPFTHEFVVHPDETGPLVAGPTGGTLLAITSVTITNFGNSPDQVRVSAPVMDGDSCTAEATAGEAQHFGTTVLLEARATLHLDYPSPLVFGAGGPPCIAVEARTDTLVTVTVNGFFE